MLARQCIIESKLSLGDGAPLDEGSPSASCGGREGHLTTRDHNRLAPSRQAPHALLRWLHIVVTQRVTWNPVICRRRTTTQPRRVAQRLTCDAQRVSASHGHLLHAGADADV
jgi:hypothetical protein